MAKVFKPLINVEVDTKALEKKFGVNGEKIKEKFGKGIEEGMETIANQMRQNAARFQWSSALYNSIEVVPTEDELGYGIKMWNYGMYLNEAPGSAHWVNIKRGNKMAFWAAAHGFIDSPWMRKPNLSKMYVLTDPKGVYRGWIDRSRANATEVIIQSIERNLGDLKNG